MLQTQDGHWACEYGGPMFLLPGYAISSYVTDTEIPDHHKKEIIKYIFHHANPEDGGWGLHIEHHSTCYGTVLNYVTLRIMGVPKDHPKMVKARALIHKFGGAVSIPTWGKMLLSCMNLYDWEGMNPVPPELWILPDWFPFHPGKMWVHSRAVYMSMSYLYGARVSYPVDDFIEQIRSEIYVDGKYPTPQEWPDHRNNICEADNYSPHSALLRFGNKILGLYEKLVYYYPSLRERAIHAAMKQIDIEDQNTKFLDIAPVNQALNLICVHHYHGKDSHSFQQHLYRVPDSLWLSHRGMMMCGTNGVQLWDTAFAVQAAIETGLHELPENVESINNAHKFIDITQIPTNSLHYPSDFRHQTQGAWPFSTRDQGYVVSDCTAEGLKATLMIQKQPFSKNLIEESRLQDAVDVLLSMINEDGGVASYELVRGGAYYELLNPAEVFANIMIEYRYPECTTATLLGLTTFNKLYPKYRADEIKEAQQKMVKYIQSVQLEDGSYYGSWGVCFTYATFFAVESLTTFGHTYQNSETVRKACDFLVTKQMEDGGWGESYKSCEQHEYYQNEESQLTNTSWAVLSLLAADYPDQELIKRGIKCIINYQNPDGSWPQQSIEGVFNHNCAISYPNYKFYFSIWALGRYGNKYGRDIEV